MPRGGGGISFCQVQGHIEVDTFPRKRWGLDSEIDL